MAHSSEAQDTAPTTHLAQDREESWGPQQPVLDGNWGLSREELGWRGSQNC